jgi:excisionase family DNA binding protein
MMDWMDVHQLAEMLGVSRHTIYAMVSRREIPFCRIGSRYRFNKAMVEECLERKTVQAEGSKNVVEKITRARRTDGGWVERIVSGAIEESSASDPVEGNSEKRAGAEPRKGEKP